MEIDKEIRALMAEFERRWNAHDGAAVAELFAADAIFTTPTLACSEGREAIARSEQEAYDTLFRDNRVRVQIERVRFLRPDVAVVNVANEILSGEEIFQTSHAMLVADSHGGRWRIAAWHNMVPLEAPQAVTGVGS
jgi:uncharacterized protein (TIGR02246 family)